MYISYYYNYNHQNFPSILHLIFIHFIYQPNIWNMYYPIIYEYFYHIYKFFALPNLFHQGLFVIYLDLQHHRHIVRVLDCPFVYLIVKGCWLDLLFIFEMNRFHQAYDQSFTCLYAILLNCLIKFLFDLVYFVWFVHIILGFMKIIQLFIQEKY
jgi:hypothetical protein